MPEDSPGVEDVFLNWLPLYDQTGSTATTVQEAEFDTEVSIFGERAMLIHEIEFIFPVDAIAQGVKIATADVHNTLGISIGKPGLSAAVAPYQGRDTEVDGIIVNVSTGYGVHFTTSGVGAYVVPIQPHVWRPATPVPYAKKAISIYVCAGVDASPFKSVYCGARIGFTYIPTSKELWRELAERWHLT